MRAFVFCAACAALVGCAKPEDQPAEVIADETACAALEEPEEPHVPQDDYNLGELEYARQHGTPLAKDLVNGRFRYGGRLTELTAVYPPGLLLNHGEYTTAVYGNEPRTQMDCLFVVARKGKMVRAHFSTCIHHPVYFDGLSDMQREECWGSYDAAFCAHFKLPLPAPAPVAPQNDGIPPPRAK